MSITLDYGIDLGTTNSTIALYKGAGPELLKDSNGNSLTPSVVHVTSEGDVVTGAAAKEYLKSDPENTSIEFKRIIGTKDPIQFPASGKTFKPEELSSFILKKLLARARAQGGFTPKAVVITIPAMFQLHQCEATREAAILAGIEYAPLLQEPIAAAIAHAHATDKREGYWLIYDLGGGTFDVSLVRSKDGRLQVLDHDGNNHLGGKDLDRLVAQEAVQIIREENVVQDFKRSNPVFAETFGKLKAEAERVRVNLSTVEKDVFQVDNLLIKEDGSTYDFKMEIDREKLESIIEKEILKTTKLCKEVLLRNKLTAAKLNGVVMVGGPTLTPCLPKIIERELQIEAKHYLNPMNIVAFGAAIFASTQKLPKNLRPQSANQDHDLTILDLEYEAMTTNPNPLIVGRILSGPKAGIGHVRLIRSDQKFQTNDLKLDSNQTFFANLALLENDSNLFSIEVLDNAGKKHPCSPSQINIIHGISVGAPPLSQSVGIMLADNSVAWYIKKGTALPTKNKLSHASTILLERGQSGEAISVPIVQGENSRADRNKVIGVLKIFARELAIDLPVGSEIQVELSIDQFSNTSARAYVRLLDQWFENVVQLDVETKTADTVHKELGSQMDRLASLSQLADQLSEDDKSEIDERVQDIESLVEEGDRDSLDKADDILRKMTKKLDTTEDSNHQVNLKTDFYRVSKDVNSVIKQEGNADEKQLMQALENEFQQAIDKQDLKQAEKKKNEMRQLFIDVYSRTDEFWAAMFLQVSQIINDQGYGGANGSALVSEGMRALENGQIGSIRQIYFDLVKMLPQEEKEKISGSDVISTVN